mmetsp:Transcript_10357/g.33032  ORF Transcript_10357/g.33032 Transcript_10357/m.33032 type:complete len:210 (+) Transcript_10357:154-783(+)
MASLINKIFGSEENKDNNVASSDLSSPVSDALKDVKANEPTKADPANQQQDYSEHRRPFPESRDARDATAEQAALRDEDKLRASQRAGAEATTAGSSASSGGLLASLTGNNSTNSTSTGSSDLKAEAQKVEDNKSLNSQLPQPVSDAMKDVKAAIPEKANPSDQQQDYAEHRRPFPESKDAKDATAEQAALQDEKRMREQEREQLNSSA